MSRFDWQRTFRSGMVAFVAGLLGPLITAIAQTYPVKPVRIVATSVGATSDFSARYIGPKLTERWGKPVVVENRGGAGGILAAELVAKSTPDG